jgi:predicted RNase H-like nuclease (RuvC/YqgF family)
LEKANSELLNIPRVKDLSDVVARLQSENESKELKLCNMNKIVQKLKTQLVSISKELAEEKLNQKANTSTVTMQQKISQLSAKINELEDKTKK